MIGSDILTIPAQSQTLLGKKVSELISVGTTVLKNGDVVGTLLYVTGFDQYSTSAEFQSGHFLPIVFGTKYSGKPITVKRRTDGDRTVTLDADRTLIIRKENLKGDTAQITSSEEPVATLNFATATLTPGG